MVSKLLFSLLVLLGIYAKTSVAQAWSGQVSQRRESFYFTQRVCRYRFWGSCCSWRTVRKCGYRLVQECTRGWTHNGNRACTIPICVSGCANGGTCTRPNVCSCRVGYSGATCGTLLCSWERPCFPGICQQSTSASCQCHQGFDGKDCIRFEEDETPEITSTSAVMQEFDPETNFILYTVTTDATGPDVTEGEVFWTNLNFFNQLFINWETFYSPQGLPLLPSYVRNVELGITKAYSQLFHQKFRNRTWIPAANFTYSCQEQVSRDNPHTGLVNCTIPAENFFNNLESSDKLDITVWSENGGYRQINPPRGSDFKDYYNGRSRSKTMKFEFDFHRPFHCKIKSNCSDEPISIDGSDIRKTMFTMRWPGWEDGLSGVYRYVWRIFKMTKQQNGNLTEILRPVYWSQVNDTNAGRATDSYTPQSPGMYSIYLQVADKANNSRFSRALVLYDPDSQVTLNESPDSKLFVSSAASETDYKWQQSLTDLITVSWPNHFANQFHEENGLLNIVSPFGIEDYISRRGGRTHVSHKFVTEEYDDKYGERTTKAIPNVHGIVKFDVDYRLATAMGESCQANSPPGNWKSVANITAENYRFNLTRANGNSVCVWVRATDSLDNTNSDVTVVHFDETPPTAALGTFTRNEAPTNLPFRSSMTMLVRDRDSPVTRIKWSLTSAQTNQLYAEGELETGLTKGECPDELSTTCECIQSSPELCYRRENKLYLPHCAINATKAEVENLVVLLDIVAVNQAGLESATRTLQIGNITALTGINNYVAPRNFKVMDVGTSAVTIQWENPDSCYTVSQIRVDYVPTTGGELKSYTTATVDNEVSLNSLYRGTDYVILIYNIYKTEISEPSRFEFTTVAIETGEIVGLVIGLLLLILVVILLIGMFILWRRGKLKSTIERRVTRARTIIMRNRVKSNMAANRRTFINNLSADDDLYTYGNLDSSAGWYLEGVDLDLQKLVAEGRFARVYHAMLNNRGISKTVAAKMLTPTKAGVDTEQMIMRAKINFMASKELINPNVIQFIGAINEDPERGPIMLLEFCENGTLKSWLDTQRKTGRVSEETVDRLFHISYGICKGMEYLISQEVLHRKLAARNILLDFAFHPKIIGFGPVPDELTDESEASSKGERLLLKWMAPEIIAARSTKNATEQSDVWSYGIVVWEIFSLGEAPYAGIKGSDLGKKLKQGIRLKRPELMSDDYDVLAKRCWNQMAEDRPSFLELVKVQSPLFDGGNRPTSYYDSSMFNHYQDS